MVAIVGALLGALTGIIPDIVNLFQKKADYKHEIELTKLQIQASIKGVELQMALEDLRADHREGDSVRDHDASISGGRFMDALRASVRPVITYCFFFLFAAVEISAIYFMATGTDMSFVEIMNAIWDDDIQGMFASILGFWFGSRAMYKYHDMKRRKMDALDTKFRGVY